MVVRNKISFIGAQVMVTPVAHGGFFVGVQHAHRIYGVLHCELIEIYLTGVDKVHTTHNATHKQYQ